MERRMLFVRWSPPNHEFIENMHSLSLFFVTPRKCPFQYCTQNLRAHIRKRQFIVKFLCPTKPHPRVEINGFSARRFPAWCGMILCFYTSSVCWCAFQSWSSEFGLPPTVCDDSRGAGFVAKKRPKVDLTANTMACLIVAYHDDWAMSVESNTYLHDSVLLYIDFCL